MDTCDIDRNAQASTKADWESVYLAHARGDRSDLIPFPPEPIQAITNALSGEPTAKQAIEILDAIMTGAATVKKISRNQRVLDYGCGWGRLTRLLPMHFDCGGIAGVDVDERLISSAQALLPAMTHAQIASMSRLPFADGHFDVVYANSVFSHLSERAFKYSVGELSRVLTVGGVAVISTLGQSHIERSYRNPTRHDWITGVLGEHKDAIAQLEEQGFVWGDTRRWQDYGITGTTTKWVQNTLQSMSLKHHGEFRSGHIHSQNYHVAVKVPPGE